MARIRADFSVTAGSARLLRPRPGLAPGSRRRRTGRYRGGCRPAGQRRGRRRGRGQARLGVYMCHAARPPAVVLPVTDGRDGELARLQDQGTGGMALLHRRAPAPGLRCCVRLDGHLGSDASRAPPWPGMSLRAAGPAVGSVRGPQGAQPATGSLCAACGTALLSRGVFACPAPSPRGALGARQGWRAQMGPLDRPG